MVVCVLYSVCVQISGAVERRWRWWRFRSMWETLPMALPPHSYIRHVYTQALCVHDCTCICVYMIVCKYMYVQCIHMRSIVVISGA